MTRIHPLRCLPAVLILSICSISAELENGLGARDYMIATDHSSPDQIGPTIHHEHDSSESTLQWEASLGVDSRYVSEGRDNLPGEGGIAWGNVVGHVHLLGGSLFGEVIGINAWEADYQELTFTAGYEFELGPVTLSAAATYLWFPEDESDDIELAIGGEWTCDCGFGLAAEAVWSTEAEGWFGEAQLFYRIAVNEHLTLAPSVFVGANQGYVGDEHDGLNHLGVQLEGSVPLGDQVELSAYFAFIEPLDEKSGESLRDLFWFGGAISCAF